MIRVCEKKFSVTIIADVVPGAAHTEGGSLIITQTMEPIHNLNFKSAMIQGWNKVCFYGSMYFEGE